MKIYNGVKCTMRLINTVDQFMFKWIVLVTVIINCLLACAPLNSPVSTLGTVNRLNVSKKKLTKVNDTHINQQPPIHSKILLNKVWQKSLTSSMQVPPILMNNGDYLLLAQGEDIYQYKTANANTIWRSRVGIVQAPLVISPNSQTVIAWLKVGQALALNALTGKILWRTALSINVQTAPLLIDNTVIFLSTDGQIIALDLMTGDRRWSVFRAVPHVSLKGAGAMVAVNSTDIMVGFSGGNILVLNALTGAILSENKVSTTQGVNEIERIADILPNWIAVPDIGMCATVYLQSLVCMNDTGKISYQQMANPSTGLFYLDHYWFILDGLGVLKAGMFLPKQLTDSLDFNYKMINQDPQWTEQTQNNPFIGLGVSNNYVLAIDFKGGLSIFSPKTGKKLTQTAISLQSKSPVTLLSIVKSGDSFIVVSNSHHLSMWAIQSP